MKIGILTFHRSINYGAVAQCYSLVEKLKDRFPNAQIEVIDYIPEFRAKQYVPTLSRILLTNFPNDISILKKIKLLISRILFHFINPSYLKNLKIRYNAFQKSMNILPLSNERYVYDNSEELRKRIYGKYDIIIVGSDCVWEWSSVPLPSAYYLFGDYKATKITFAASAGVDDFNKLSSTDEDTLSHAISEFSYVGVRDTSTEYIVNQACPKLPYFHNCDPTTFLDKNTLNIHREKVYKMLEEYGIDFNKKIIGVMGNKKIGKLARDIFGNDAQYIGLYCQNKYCDINLMNLEVLEWASIFDLFNITFTTFFHGTMLSLVNHTPVISIDYLPETDKQITKLHELYNRLNLPDFYHRDLPVYTQNDIYRIGNIAKKLVNNPPRELIKKELEKEALTSESFFEYIDSLNANI